jgi:hypothetical protein
MIVSSPSGASNLRTQNRLDSAMLDLSIVRREKWNRQFRYRVRTILDARSVGIAEPMWREISSSTRFESGARAAKILRWSVA